MPPRVKTNKLLAGATAALGGSAALATPDDADAATLLDPTLTARAARAWAQLAPELRLLPDEEALRGVGGAPTKVPASGAPASPAASQTPGTP